MVVDVTLLIRSCGRGCMTYVTEDGRYDVAAYNLSCPIHGWRYDAGMQGADYITLEEAEARDRRAAEAELGASR